MRKQKKSEEPGYRIRRNGRLLILPKDKADNHKILQVRLEKEVVDQIDAIAEQTGWSRNELVCKMLEYGLGRYTIEEPEESAEAKPSAGKGKSSRGSRGSGNKSRRATGNPRRRKSDAGGTHPKK